MNDFFLHLTHPLVVAGLGLLLLTFIIRMIGRRKRFSGKAEWLLIRGRVILPVVALLAVAAGLVMSWNSLSIRLNSQAVLCYQKGQYEEAERLYKRSIEVAEKTFGRDSLNVAAVLNNLAELYKTQKRNSEAENVLYRVINLIEGKLEEDSQEFLEIVCNLAEISLIQDKHDKAEFFYLKEIDILKKFYKEDYESMLTSMNNLAGIYRIQRRYSEAELLYKSCIGIAEEKFGENSYELTDFLDNIAELYEYKKEFVDAISARERSLAIYKTNLPEGHQLIKTAQENYDRVKRNL